MQSYNVDTPNGGRGLENEKTTLFEENLSMETSIARICFFWESLSFQLILKNPKALHR